MGKLKQFLLSTRLNQADHKLSLELQLEAQYYQYTEQRKKWTTEQKNAENATILEWEQLHKPNKQNTNLKFD